MDMKELRKNAEKVIAERFPDFNFSKLFHVHMVSPHFSFFGLIL